MKARDARRRRERVSPQPDKTESPARTLKLVIQIHSDLLCLRNSPAAKHEGGRKRPGLTRVVADISNDDSRLFIDLAPDGFFEGFAGFEEACKAGVEAGGPGSLRKDVEKVRRAASAVKAKEGA